MRAMSLLVAALASGSALADPPLPSHDHWRNTSDHRHYVLYDAASHKYHENINCQVYWSFTLVSNQLNLLTLYDASRDMTIQLNYDGMYLHPSGASSFTFYQPGKFDTRTQFQHFDASGAYTGAISKRDNCVWQEWFPGGSSPAFTFVEKSVSDDAVELYDASRDMWVRLTSNGMYLHTGNAAYGFFKSGHW